MRWLAVLAIATATLPAGAQTSTSTPPPEKHHLGGGFRGQPVAVPSPVHAPEPKPSAAAPSRARKTRPVVINNETVGSKEDGGSSHHQESGSAEAPPPTPATSVTPQPQIPAIKDLQGHDENYWRERARATRDRVEKARESVVSVEADEHRLENDFYSWDDGQYRDRVIKPEWDKVKQALIDAKAEVTAAEAALDDLSEDARKSGALPGWIR